MNKRKYKKRNNFTNKINPSRFINRATQSGNECQHEVKNTFSDFNIDQRLKRNIINLGYEEPTPIQDKIIPDVLRGCDAVGIADTGTGKTAAFLLPMVNKILKNRSEKVLIITPTRELALQINLDFKKFSKGLSVFSVCCVGGSSIREQISELSRNHNVIIGTPGRLKDLINRKTINPSIFNNVILDEADRMLDMGFIVDIRFIINKTSRKRQTLLFSATMSKRVEVMINEFTEKPAKVFLKKRDTSENVEQDIVKVKRGEEKIDILHSLLIAEEFTKVLIFGRTKVGVEKISKELISRGLQATSIHGNKTNSQRQKALKLFQENKIKILVATDVAARGLNLNKVTHVINYDTPATYEDYIHRIGRTGRLNQKGVALTFVS